MSIATGLALGGMATARTENQRTAIERARVGLEARRLGLEDEKVARSTISDALKQTRDEINDLVAVAREAKAKGATPEQLAPLRRQIEVAGAQLGMTIPGLPQVRGALPVPGAEPVVQMGLNRFDALVGATPGPKPDEAAAGPFPGSGFDAATANIATTIAGKAQSGTPLSAEDRRAYSIAYGKMTEPRVVGSAESGFKIVTPTLDPTLFPHPTALGSPAAPDATAATDGSAVGLPEFRDAIASIESAGSGDYSALGPVTKSGDRAYGRYQVMGSNVGPWTREVLGRAMTPEQFLADPKAQDAVFDAKFGGLVAKYGDPREAASVWFTGRPIAEGANARDVNGVSGTEYVDKFTRAVAGAVSPPAAAASSSSAAAGGPAFTVESLGPRTRNPEQAGRVALITQGLETARQVRDAIVTPQGIDRGLLSTMNAEINLPFIGQIMGGVPWTEGRGVRSKLKDALSAKLRIETGAQQNDEEVENILDRFAPSLFDSDSTIKDKMERLVSFFDQSLETTDPELADKLLKSAEESGTAPKPPEDEPDATFRGFRADGLAIFKRPDGSYFGVVTNGR